jgi:hypothetical protein
VVASARSTPQGVPATPIFRPITSTLSPRACQETMRVRCCQAWKGQWMMIG